MASPRRLAYKDIFVWFLEQVVSSEFDDCDDFADRFVFPDMDTKQALVLYLSQTEFTTLYSAVMTGADLTYPDTAHNVELLFLQSVICAMNSFCAAMIDCLENDPDTLAALIQALSNSGYTGGVGDPTAPLSDDILGGNLLPVSYTCTDDKAFGMAYAVVDALHENTLEVLQAIEILTNPAEIAAELADNVPGIGALSSGADVARWIQDSAAEAYDLAWSSVTRDELACLIWCDFKGSCYLSYDTVWAIYLSQAGVSPPPGVLLTDWLVWLIGLPFVAALKTVATINLMGLLAMRYGGSFGGLGLGIRSLETVINLAQDDTSSDWSTVCDACPSFWCYTWLNGSDLNMWVSGGFGCDCVITTTEVTGCTEQINTGQYCDVTIDFVQPADLTRVRFTTDLNPTRGSQAQATLYVDGSIVYTSGNQPGVFEHDVAGSWSAVEDIRITCIAASNLTGTSPDAEGALSLINEIVLDGGGSNPMGADNC